MSVFIDSQGAEDVKRWAETSRAATPYDFSPGVVGGTIRAIGKVVPSIQARLGYAATEAVGTYAEEGAWRLDRLLGTSTTEYVREARARAKEYARESVPRPWELGTVGGFVHDLAVGATELVVPTVAIGGIVGPTAAYAYAAWTQGLMREMELTDRGVDKTTAARTAFAGSTVSNLGAFATGSFHKLIPGLGPWERYAFEGITQAGVNVGLGVAQRATEAKMLREAGHEKLADEMRPFGLAELGMDAAIALVLSPLGVHGKVRAGEIVDVPAGERTAPGSRTLPATESVDQVTAQLNVAHGAIDTRPGIPATPNDAEAHVEALIQATEQLLNGEQVSVQDKMNGTTFAEPPPAIKRERAEAEAAMLEGINDELAAAEISRAETVGGPPPAPTPVHVIDPKPLEKLHANEASTLRQMYEQAGARKPDFDAAITAIANALGGVPQLAPLKSSARAVSKIVSEYAGIASKINDLLRATVLVSDLKDTDAALAAVLAKYPLGGKMRNGYAPDAVPSPDGYRDILVKVDVNGHVAEVQVNTPAMAEAKERMHALYERRDGIMRDAKDEARAFTDAESAEIIALNDQMRRNYEAAYAADLATSARKSASETGMPLRYADAPSKLRGGPSQAVAPNGEPSMLPTETGMPSTSNNATEAGITAGSPDIATPSDARIAQNAFAVKALDDDASAGGKVPAPGEPFIVYRLGSGEGLEGRNAGNARGVAEHLGRFDDPDRPKPKQGVGETIDVYTVTVEHPFGEYELSNMGKGVEGETTGRREIRHGDGAVIYSFPTKGFTATKIASVPLADVRERLKAAGYDDFDESGSNAGGDTIAALAREAAAREAPAPAEKVDFKTYVARMRERRAALEADLEARMARDETATATREDGKYKYVLTRGMAGEPFRVTSLDMTSGTPEPSGHRVYNTIADAAQEFMGDMKLDALPAATGPKSNLADAAYGSPGEVLLGDAYVATKWALVEADTLAPSVEKSESQARDRTRAASHQQVATIAANLDFRRLADSPEMGTGAPTLSNAGAIIGGNARTLAIRRAYDQDTAGNYRQALELNAEKFGFTPEAVAGMKQPALVRVLVDDVNVRKAAVASNEGGGLRMSLLEQAPVDAERLPPMAGFHVTESGDLNSPENGPYIMAWVREFPGSEQGNLVDHKGTLSQEGIIRMRNAILFRAYGESQTLARLIELTDPGMKNLSTGLTRAGPPVAVARDAIAAGTLHPLDLTPDIIAASEILMQLRAEGIKVAKFLSQGDMLGGALSETGRRLLVYFDANARSARRMADVVAAYYARLEQAGNPRIADMFGGGGVPKREALLDQAIRDVEQPESPTLALFTQKPDDFPGTVAAPRSAEQMLYKANARVDDANNEAPRALDAAVECEMA